MKRIFKSLSSLVFVVSICLFTGCAKDDEQIKAWYEYRMIAHAGGGHRWKNYDKFFRGIEFVEAKWV